MPPFGIVPRSRAFAPARTPDDRAALDHGARTDLGILPDEPAHAVDLVPLPFDLRGRFSTGSDDRGAEFRPHPRHRVLEDAARTDVDIVHQDRVLDEPERPDMDAVAEARRREDHRVRTDLAPLPD